MTLFQIFCINLFGFIKKQKTKKKFMRFSHHLHFKLIMQSFFFSFNLAQTLAKIQKVKERVKNRQLVAKPKNRKNI